MAVGVVETCKADGTVQTNTNPRNSKQASVDSYMCPALSPIVVSSTLSYGWTAYGLSGDTAQEQERACACYHLRFSGELSGKQMVVQATNTGDLTMCKDHFDLQIPGAGFGQVNCCINDGEKHQTRTLDGKSVYQFSSPAHNGVNWGPIENDIRGGITSESACASLPAGLRAG